MDGFAIAVYRGSSGATIPLTEYVAMSVAERRRVRADLEAVAVSIVVDGRERLAHMLSMGPLARLVAQLEPARERLAGGAPALIRSGVLDIPVGHYLLFEPAPDGAHVLVSVVSIDALEPSVWFPDEAHADELYEHVAMHRTELIAASRGQGAGLVELALDRATLLEALMRDATAGHALADAPRG